VWGEGVVDHLAQHLARTMPGQRGCTRRNHYGVPFINTATARLIATGITHYVVLML